MSPLLGIELGPSRCVLALVDGRRGSRGALRVMDHHVVRYQDPAQLTGLLKDLRTRLKLPRQARVAVWPETPEGAPAGAALRAMLRPLVKAGFRPQRVVGATDAAGALAALVSPLASCAIALNPEAGAIAVVHRDKVLAAKTLTWRTPPPAGDASLLERYSFISHLAPEAKRLIAGVRGDHDIRVERVVLCGSVRAIRAFAAPLIEELDVEVDVLDGLDGVTERVEVIEPDRTAAAQLAAGAALVAGPAGLPGTPILTVSRILIVLGVAAAVALILLLVLFWPGPRADGLNSAVWGAPRGSCA